MNDFVGAEYFVPSLNIASNDFRCSSSYVIVYKGPCLSQKR